ncbi:hypothetical protein QBC44DRAFT_364044 [Cladorrhinum sp. PSN332]|nr:hypothetical protein QBC44DRAFT_364044 [Cladorrhinum sp. PSN332]
MQQVDLVMKKPNTMTTHKPKGLRGEELFEKLPQELWDMIATHLHIDELKAAVLASKLFHFRFGSGLWSHSNAVICGSSKLYLPTEVHEALGAIDARIDAEPKYASSIFATTSGISETGPGRDHKPRNPHLSKAPRTRAQNSLVERLIPAVLVRFRKLNQFTLTVLFTKDEDPYYDRNGHYPLPGFRVQKLFEEQFGIEPPPDGRRPHLLPRYNFMAQHILSSVPSLKSVGIMVYNFPCEDRDRARRQETSYGNGMYVEATRDEITDRVDLSARLEKRQTMTWPAYS